MNKIEKLYRSMYENELCKLRKCADSVQKLSQYVVFKAWSKEVMAYLFFKIDRLDYTWEYRDKIAMFIQDCQEIALRKVKLSSKMTEERKLWLSICNNDLKKLEACAESIQTEIQRNVFWIGAKR